VVIGVLLGSVQHELRANVGHSLETRGPAARLVESSAHRVSEVSLTSGRYTGDGEAEMRTHLQRRLEALERRFSTDQEPGKAFLPEFLVAEFLAKGFSFDHKGRPISSPGVAQQLLANFPNGHRRDS